MKERIIASIGVLVIVGIGIYTYMQYNPSTQSLNSTKVNPMKLESISGLAYTILKKAPENADVPSYGQKVTVHYTGWLDNKGEPGEKFDSSVDRGEPFQFNIGVGQVIKGWDEGVFSMQVGEKRRLFIPAQLGYGAYGAGDIIPPHANLIFDVELLKVG